MEPVKLTTLDGRTLSVCFDELVSPQTLRVISGEGMPKAVDCEAPHALRLAHLRDLPKGDLYVRFEIEFPTNLSTEQRNAILGALAANDAELNN